jgi:O-antigen biosynthesis protein WbqP
MTSTGSAMVKRGLDITLSAALLLLLAPLMLAIALAVKLSSSGPVLHLSPRVGRDNRIFTMLKFRTMRVDTPQVATHLLENPDRFLTPAGGFLRRTSFDELPQLLNVLRGEMSLVGPRPALYNQRNLIALRTERGIHRLTPGLTGWAQINGRDQLAIPVKVALEEQYLQRRSNLFDLRILLFTIASVSRRSEVSH